MNIVATADWHLLFGNPRIRKDNYVETQFRKVSWIADYCNENGAALLIAGDLTDKPVFPIYWLNHYIALLKTIKKGVFAAFGQHDIFYHNPDLSRTPFGTLLVSNAISNKDDICSMVNFGEDLENMQKENGIVMVHFPVTPKEPPFFMKEALSAKDFMDKMPNARIIISGDYHEHFIRKEKDRILINPGPIMRRDKNKIDYKPCVVLLDVKSLDYEKAYIPIEQDVFDLNVSDKDDMSDYKDSVRELAQNIRVQSIGKKFREVLSNVMDTGKADKTSRIIISTVMEKVDERLGKN